jgi:plastocyanin domain-containing protein
MRIGYDFLSQQGIIMAIAINIIGLGLIALVVWWFWLYKPTLYVSKKENIKTRNIIEILVKDGVYAPTYIQVALNNPITLRFTRKDASPCAEIVNFSSLNISRQLPLGEPIDIDIKLDKAGEYEFTCQMGMYRGKLIAK